jgi:hypothetical protein
MAWQMSKLNAPQQVAIEAAEDAIANVLDAERAAREDVERAQQQAHEMAELTRTRVRAVAERTERRIRCVAAAFETELAAQLRALDAQTSRASAAHVLGDDQLAALARAVGVLARELTGGPP